MFRTVRETRRAIQEEVGGQQTHTKLSRDVVLECVVALADPNDPRAFRVVRNSTVERALRQELAGLVGFDYDLDERGLQFHRDELWQILDAVSDQEDG